MLKIIKAKPNPLGKDRINNIIPVLQLAGEWVDIKNTGNESVSLDSIKLQHIAYTIVYPNGVWTKVIKFNGFLGAGEIIRVHSGGEVLLNLLPREDYLGANYHLFTGENFVWNNPGDTARLVINQQVLDQVSYLNAPNGVILIRRDLNINLLS